MKFRDGHNVRLLRNGGEYFPELEQEIDRAGREVFLETYIFEADATGERIAQALMRAAGRGVAVHVLIDGFGSRSLPGPWRSRFLDGGVRLMVYRPELSPFDFKGTRLRRMHRKLAVIDGRIGFCGGINVLDDIDSAAGAAPRYDYAVRIEGPLLTDMRAAMLALWRRTAWIHLHRRWLLLSSDAGPPQPAGDQRAALLVRDNFRHRRDIEDAYLERMARARQEILIANAYFLPGRKFRDALCDAAARGVRVVLLLQGRVEYFLVHHATRALYGELLAAGVEIHEYHRSFLHAKVAVIDGDWSTVGSSNIDPVSLLLAREANVVIEDERFGRELRASLEDAIRSDAGRVTAHRWGRTGAMRRLLATLAYGLVRWLTAISAYGNKGDFR